MNLRDCVWAIRCRIIMKFISQEKVKMYYSTSIWFTNLLLFLKPWKFLQQKQRWTRNGKNWRKFRRGTWQKSNEAERRTLQFICIINGHRSSEKCWIGSKAPKIQRSSCAPRWYCERRLRVLRSIHSNKDLQHLKWQQDIISRLPGCDGQATDAVSACTL